MRVHAKFSAFRRPNGKSLMDKFAFSPWIGASGGLLTVWNSRFFDGNIVQGNTYAITIKFYSKQENKSFHVINVYGPAHSAQKMAFVTWLMNLHSSDFDDWLLAGDFTLYRNPKNRSKPGGDLSEMNMFNELISDLDLHDIPFSGRHYTWSNMQADPLMVKLDWVFTSPNWAISYPATFVQPVSKLVSDHIPFAIHIGRDLKTTGLSSQVSLTLLLYTGTALLSMLMQPKTCPAD